jgi:hypothetical protein
MCIGAFRVCIWQIQDSAYLTVAYGREIFVSAGNKAVPLVPGVAHPSLLLSQCERGVRVDIMKYLEGAGIWSLVISLLCGCDRGLSLSLGPSNFVWSESSTDLPDMYAHAN